MTAPKAKTATKARPAPDPVWRALEGVHSRVNIIEHVLAPAFAPTKREAPAVPERNTVSSSGTTSNAFWGQFPEYDDDFMRGDISLEQARARHPERDDGCACGNCTADRKHRAQRYAMPAPEFTPRPCPICMGTGFQGRPVGMGWTPCTSCSAEEFYRLQAETFHNMPDLRTWLVQPNARLEAARQGVIACTECNGRGKVWEGVPSTPCAACKGSGQDNHCVMAPGVLWPRAGGDFARDTSGGAAPEQHQHWSTLPDPEPVAAGSSMPEANADVPDYIRARHMGEATGQLRSGT